MACFNERDVPASHQATNYLMEKYIDVCHGSLLAVVCVLHLTTPEKHVIGKILGVNQDHQREGEQQPLIDVLPMREINEDLGDSPNCCQGNNHQKSELEDRAEETLNHNRSFAIGKRVRNLWLTYHSENSP